MNKERPLTTIGKRVFRVLSGFELALICLILLFLLTFFSTVEQQWIGLHSTIKKYFDLNSFFVVPRNAHDKIICFPLPGAYWVMAVLTLNMILGGIVRMKKGWKNAGVLVSHFAIVFMMIAGGVSSLSKVEGMMLVTEGERSDYAQKYHRPSIEVFKYNEQGERQAPLIIKSEDLNHLRPTDVLRANFANEDFHFEITGFFKATNLFKASNEQKGKEDGPVVDGFFLREAVWNVDNELANMAGCYVSVRDEKNQEIEKLILWMGNSSPVSFSHQGQRFGVVLTAEIWPMPFEVELNESVGEYYPGTRKASTFQSSITKVTSNERTDYEIYMNHPMRHGGYTLFQSQWSDAGERPYSGFAIVTNPSDQWPKYSLYIATVGLLGHFVFMLIRFAGGSARSKEKPKS